jgi:hypothetical protein
VAVAVGLSLILLVGAAISLNHHISSANWPQDLRNNLALADGPGGINDPTPEGTDAMLLTNLQTVFAVFDTNPGFYNGATWLVVAVLGI